MGRSCFDAFLSAARRRGESPHVVSSGRTLVAEFEDGEWLAPFCGTHRIQRIPKGSRSRHTSTTTVALLDDGGGVNNSIREADIEEQFDRGGGKGGQHQNTTDSAVTLIHKPTGITVHAEGRKQWSNRQKAREELERRVIEAAQAEALRIRNTKRRSQISSGERPVKQFTHNSQRNEVVDHGSGKKWRMDRFMKGRF